MQVLTRGCIDELCALDQSDGLSDERLHHATILLVEQAKHILEHSFLLLDQHFLAASGLCEARKMGPWVVCIRLDFAEVAVKAM